jgi:PHD/YefM family antitoxin component YafN of YafNO toxin-antitoxin module
MEDINELVFITRESKKEIIRFNEDEYSTLNHIEKLELLLTLKLWVREQIDKLGNT